MRLLLLYPRLRGRLAVMFLVAVACLLLAMGYDSQVTHAESHEATAIHGSIGREYAVPNGPRNLVAEGPGRIWYTATDAGGIGFLEVISDTATFVVRYNTEFYGLGEKSQPYDLVYNNGFVWFTLRGIRSLGKIDVVTREIKTFPLLSFGAAPTGIDVDNAGRLWIAQSNGRISRFDPVTETFTEFIMPDTLAAAPHVEDIAYQNDSNIWLTMPDGNLVAIYDPIRDRFFEDPTGVSPFNIYIDEKGTIWVTAFSASLIGRRTITSVSRWVWFETPEPESGPTGIIVFADDLNVTQVWFTENKRGSIGRIQLYNTFRVVNRERLTPALPVGHTWGITRAPDKHIWVADAARNVLYELAPPYIYRTFAATIKLSTP